MKSQTQTEPHACPPRPVLEYVRSHLKCLAAEDASLVTDTGILTRQTTNVRIVRSDMCKIPPTSTMRPVWFVRTAKVEQFHKLHARIVQTDNLTTVTVFANNAPATQY